MGHFDSLLCFQYILLFPPQYILNSAAKLTLLICDTDRNISLFEISNDIPTYEIRLSPLA